MYSLDDQNKLEEGIRFINEELSKIPNLPKPVLFHSIRVGTFLYFRRYPFSIVLAGYLHDIIEDTPHTQESISAKFGQDIGELVQANSKNASIEPSAKRNEELIKRCANHSQAAAIVKAADIIDNFHFYTFLNSERGLDYCKNNAKHLRRYMKKTYTDPIFTELFELVAEPKEG